MKALHLNLVRRNFLGKYLYASAFYELPRIWKKILYSHIGRVGWERNLVEEGLAEATGQLLPEGSVPIDRQTDRG